MHRNKDVILGEDGYTNRCDNAPRNIFSLTGFVLKILKFVSHSPTRAIEHFQDNKNRAIHLLGESGSTRTPIPGQGGQQSGDRGQQVLAG